MASNIYTIKLLPSLLSGDLGSAWRLGNKYITNEPVQVELTDEELEVFNADFRFEVSGGTDTSKKNAGGDASKSKTIPSSSNVEGAEADAGTAEIVADKNVAQEKTSGSKSKKKAR